MVTIPRLAVSDGKNNEATLLVITLGQWLDRNVKQIEIFSTKSRMKKNHNNLFHFLFLLSFCFYSIASFFQFVLRLFYMLFFLHFFLLTNILCCPCCCCIYNGVCAISCHLHFVLHNVSKYGSIGGGEAAICVFFFFLFFFFFLLSFWFNDRV